jgi:hypothetical protein
MTRLFLIIPFVVGLTGCTFGFAWSWFSLLYMDKGSTGFFLALAFMLMFAAVCLWLIIGFIKSIAQSSAINRQA